MKQSFKEELTECYNTAWWEARQDRVRSLPTSDELKRCLVEELRKCDGAFHAAEEKMNSCVVKMKVINIAFDCNVCRLPVISSEKYRILVALLLIQ